MLRRIRAGKSSPWSCSLIAVRPFLSSFRPDSNGRAGTQYRRRQVLTFAAEVVFYDLVGQYPELLDATGGRRVPGIKCCEASIAGQRGHDRIGCSVVAGQKHRRQGERVMPEPNVEEL